MKKKVLIAAFAILACRAEAAPNLGALKAGDEVDLADGSAWIVTNPKPNSKGIYVIMAKKRIRRFWIALCFRSRNHPGKTLFRSKLR